MPLYEYKCGACGDVFEVIQKFVDQPLTVHDKCGGQVERLISTSALQFKGSGWYVNDYGKGNSKDPKPTSDTAGADKANGSSKPAETSSKSESSAKSDTSSTPATPAASKSDTK